MHLLDNIILTLLPLAIMFLLVLLIYLLNPIGHKNIFVVDFWYWKKPILLELISDLYNNKRQKGKQDD